MDPNLFHLDWERLFEVMAAIVVLAFFLERGLAIVFENKIFLKSAGAMGVREPIAFIVAALVCWYWDFDAISMILPKEKTSLWGTVITGAIVAGGSKASVKLFRDILGFRSNAWAEFQEKKTKAKATKGTLAQGEAAPSGGAK
jgi:hypothetical protein